MIPVKQNRFGPDEGNCLTACIASIFEVPLESLPQFCKNAEDDEWFERLEAWLAGWGLSPICVKATKDFKLADTYAILSGKSPRGQYLHSVVWKDGEIVHDPHPSNDGLEVRVDFIVFTVKDPAHNRP